MAACAHVRTLVRPLDTARLPHRVHGDDRLLVREEDPLPVLRVELPPRPVDVVPQGVEDVPEVLPLPGARPGGDRTLTDGQIRLGDQEILAGVVDQPESVTRRARARGRVGGEGVGVEPLRTRRIAPGPREQHPQGVGESGHRTHGGAGVRGRPALLQRDRRRQPGDLTDRRRPHLVDQPPRVRGHRLEVAALGLGVDRPEGQRRLAGPGDPGERDERVTRDVDVDPGEIVLTGTSDADVRIVRGVLHGATLSNGPRLPRWVPGVSTTPADTGGCVRGSAASDRRPGRAGGTTRSAPPGRTCSW
ncbi:hypothetical protein STANM309S_03231 [Streptomyces tanashiensis]